MTTPTPIDSSQSWDRRLVVGPEVDNARGEPSPTRQSQVGEFPSARCRLQVGYPRIGYPSVVAARLLGSLIRNDRHFQIAKHYIENNPVAAGLATSLEA